MNIVVAVYDDWGIGRDGGQPVVVKADRRHFKEVTGSGTVILGRRTLEDFPGGRPLKGRRNIILTRDKSFSVDSGEVVHSVSEAIRAAESEDPDSVFVIGGESIYGQMLPYCHKAFVTRIFENPLSDVFFPDLDALPEWDVKESSEIFHEDEIAYQFFTYVHTEA